MKKFVLFALGTLLVLTSCNRVGSLTKDGMKAYNEGKYDKAVEYFTKAVEKDPQKAGEAARMLGICYSDSATGMVDYKKSIR